MPVETRSKTRSRATAPLPAVSEHPDIRDCSDGEPKASGSAERESPSYDPAEEQRQARTIAEAVEANTTPKIRKKTSTVNTTQREGASREDPNSGRCFLTNRPVPVQLRHIVANATKDETLAKLEYVWGIEPGQLHLDTRYNLMHLRDDWHSTFDNAQWVLIPELDVLQSLSEIFKSKKARRNMEKYFGKKIYRYYVLAIPPFGEPIFRFPDARSRDFQTHWPPFTTLGPLLGHFHPHFVIFNTGRKLAGLSADVIVQMTFSLGQTVDPSNNPVFMISTIQTLYTQWMEAQVPDNYCNTSGPSNRSPVPSEGGQDDELHSGPRQGLRSATRSHAQSTQATSAGHTGGQQRATLPFKGGKDDDSSSESDTNDTIYDDSTEWINDIHIWQHDAAQRLLDVPDGMGDKQLADYMDEHARSPPSPDAWRSWKPVWGGVKRRCLSASDRSQFSSNDWAVYEQGVYLTRSQYV